VWQAKCTERGLLRPSFVPPAPIRELRDYAVMADITSRRNLSPARRHRSYPRVVKRARHNSYRVKRPATPEPVTTDLPPSASPTPPRPAQQHDQLTLSGIVVS
jgi:hypothetical protein